MFSSNFKFKNYKLYLIFIFFFWIINLLLYFFFSDLIKSGALENGVKFGNDTQFYLREANRILNGEASIMDYKSKFGYILFLAFFIHYELPFTYVVFFQISLTFLSAICLYKITSRFFVN